MIEFGEKLKQMREEKGMTQQTLAEQLYVTRQAVSRWECGARYPDLLTAKKIAEILETTIDELVSGEAGKETVEREPLLTGAKYRVLQIIMYVAGCIPFLLMTVFSIKTFFPEESLRGTPAGQVTVLTVTTTLQYVAVMMAMVTGLFFALRNKLSPAKIGVLMSVPFWAEAFNLSVQYLQELIKGNTTVGYVWPDVIWCLLAGLCIICFFYGKGCRNKFIRVLLSVGIGCIGIHRLYIILLACKNLLLNYTDLGFVVRTVHVLGEVVLVVLLLVQTLALMNKRARIKLL